MKVWVRIGPSSRSAFHAREDCASAQKNGHGSYIEFETAEHHMLPAGAWCSICASDFNRVAPLAPERP